MNYRTIMVAAGAAAMVAGAANAFIQYIIADAPVASADNQSSSSDGTESPTEGDGETS